MAQEGLKEGISEGSQRASVAGVGVGVPLPELAVLLQFGDLGVLVFRGEGNVRDRHVVNGVVLGHVFFHVLGERPYIHMVGHSLAAQPAVRADDASEQEP